MSPNDGHFIEIGESSLLDSFMLYTNPLDIEN